MEAKWSNKLLDIRQLAAEASEEPQRLRKCTLWPRRVQE